MSRRYLTSILAAVIGCGSMVSRVAADGDPRILIERMVKAVGGVETLRSLEDVEYEYTYLMFKLLDPGISYKRLPSREVNGIVYNVVEISFGESVGDAKDTHVLYLNPTTHLVDQFLFTVMDFNMSNPLLMVVKYAEINGVKLPTARSYVSSDWEGNVRSEKWTAEISDKIRFMNGFSRDQFERPPQ